uniref:Uncharacterized protein n=1 Tax=Anguilla anguilla TaxID=7936 RepID=A0A0E9WNM2_ANGAN
MGIVLRSDDLLTPGGELINRHHSLDLRLVKDAVSNIYQ